MLWWWGDILAQSPNTKHRWQTVSSQSGFAEQHLCVFCGGNFISWDRTLTRTLTSRLQSGVIHKSGGEWSGVESSAAVINIPGMQFIVARRQQQRSSCCFSGGAWQGRLSTRRWYEPHHIWGGHCNTQVTFKFITFLKCNIKKIKLKRFGVDHIREYFS